MRPRPAAEIIGACTGVTRRAPRQTVQYQPAGRATTDLVKSQASLSRFRAALCTLRSMLSRRPKPLRGLLAGLLAFVVFASAAVGMTSGSSGNAPSTAQVPAPQIVTDANPQAGGEGHFRRGDAEFAVVRGRDDDGRGDGGR